MAQPNTPRLVAANAGSKKRREPPTGQSNTKNDQNKRHKPDHRSKQRDARMLSTQLSSAALRNGELDVEKFVKAREYEIRALEEGMTRSKKALTKRAFQQVPKELRRRTASHNAKKVPKRLQKRAKREMAEDSTSNGTARKKKPTRHMRLRQETLKRLRSLGAKQKKTTQQGGYPKVVSDTDELTVKAANGIVPRKSRTKKAHLATPPVPKAKFRKRQIDKTWLPTHMFHAKRARMTPPSAPLWRFALPLTPTVKSYRPTHRAANERGAVAWDMSYMSTIELQGQQNSIGIVLKALGVGTRDTGNSMWATKGQKWRAGKRVWQGFASQRESPHSLIAPVVVIWSAAQANSAAAATHSTKRGVFIRVHPAAFAQLWEEVVRAAKVAKPQVTVEDLRYQVGSIEMTGPCATEALVSALWPSEGAAIASEETARTLLESTWKRLAGLSNPAGLPNHVLLSFDAQDPRLHHPPRTVQMSRTSDEHDKLLETITTWPVDGAPVAISLFDRRSRQTASSKLPTQKAINRRKTLAEPGSYPAPVATDPRIPVLMYCTRSAQGNQASWTVLLPWKCVVPVWYSVMYYPLATGGQPRFGGLMEKRQLAFETGTPSFPQDYPGTAAGYLWETQERKRRLDEWKRRPKSKRVNWDTVDIGNGEKGELGEGWACDWGRLVSGSIALDKTQANGDASASDVSPAAAPKFEHCTVGDASTLLGSPARGDSLPNCNHPLATVRVDLLNRGVPAACARVYRLPSEHKNRELRKKWLALHPKNQVKQRGPRNGLPRLPPDAPAHVVQRRLVQSLIEPLKVGEDDYPACPAEEDLIGFITTGNYNLGEGQGTGIGSVLLERVRGHEGEESRLCIVRNVGTGIGRLAKWDLV
ncbi:ribonuclease P complex subunit Pop1 like protein [Zymoseptoria brevis]|uniref:Ribonuclease P complex subunit Pop1 like protein n=1 Tax=Zymoseptoria brevis TaxID=1047168 RepID=A0A0F4GQI9_9PEZI|nr:ribonuclease P complex subunit Pop1 like protein [Zymoseptoria brevis]